jgi:hypothetical protein
MKSLFAMQKTLLISFLISVGMLSSLQSGVVMAADAATATPASPAATAPATPAPAATTKPATPTPASTAPSGKAPAAASSMPAIAQAIWVKGAVIATGPDGAPRTLTRRAVVYEHDVVTTDKTSTGEIGFTDGSLMTLNNDSSIKIDEYKFKAGGGTAENKSVMGLVKGGFRTITGAIPKENPDGYKINTPVATIGVRGTEFVTQLSPLKGLLLKIEKGSIIVINAGGSMDLTKCSSGTGSCEDYGVVKNFDIKPESTDKMPSEMANAAPPVTTLPTGWGAPGKAGAPGSPSAPGSGGSSSPGGGGSGPSKSVGSFCVGLLTDFMDQVHKIFG